MNRKEHIAAILTQALQPIHLEVRDNSHQHVGHIGAQAGGQTHYEVVVTAECFRGLSKVQCHQMIYKLLVGEFQTGLHALSIEAKAKEP